MTQPSEDLAIKRTPCQVYTRVMGYLRPVSHYNIGKKSEFYSRKTFLEEKCFCKREQDLIEMNRKFIEDYS